MGFGKEAAPNGQSLLFFLQSKNEGTTNRRNGTNYISEASI